MDFYIISKSALMSLVSEHFRLSGILRGSHKQIRRIDIITEKALNTSENPD